MAGQNYTWQASSPNIGTGVGVISSAYAKGGNSPLSTITPSNPTGYTNVFPNSTSTDLNIKNLQYAIQNDGKITYRVLDGTQNPIQYNSLQELANSRGNWQGTTTQQVQSQLNGTLSSAAKANNLVPTAAAPAGPGSTSAPNNGGAAAPNNGGAASIGTGGASAVASVGTRINNYDKTPLVYPINRQGYGGDYIQFEIRTYQKSGLASPTAQGFTKAEDVTLVGMEKRKSEPLAYIYLPIQSGISDSMSVNWGDGELSPITAAFANAAYNTINAGGTGDAGKILGSVVKDMKQIGAAFNAAEGELRQMVINSFTEGAVGVSGLLSRTMGAAINNNLELLFNGPMLRSFTFNFKLTPREPKEALVIKKIIRYFKKSMVPGLSNSKLFLLAPNVFKIKYIYTGKGNIRQSHPYLNKIKVAALRDFSVNYTPDGNYMTYDDPNGLGAGSMTQYDLSMTFGEIDPIYEPDYESGEGTEENGMGW
jgi:hypothetical protein